MVALTIYVEGGGQTNDLRTACRAAFSKLIQRIGIANSMPTIFASGSRSEAYDDFRTALKQGRAALLLVDAEDPLSSADPWAHVASRPGDGWEKPEGARLDDLHFMVLSTEAWLLADHAAIASHYGKNFNPNALPKRPVEEISRSASVAALADAAKDTKKKGYKKGRDTFAILAMVDSARIRTASPWADRFFAEVQRRMTNG